jgi:uncharacterized membrane protein YkoI
MLRSKLIPAVMAAVIAVGTSGVAFAATNGKGEDASEIQAALSAEVTAGQAIAAAEKNTGGRALEVGLEDENGGVLYEVKTITQDKVVEAFIDPATGQVIRTKEEGLVARMFDQEDKAELARLAQSPTDLAAAIAAAEQETGGKALEAAHEDENGHAIFEVEVVKDNVVQQVKVDGATGKVMKVSAAESGDESED